jgi:hypothetical protein
MKRTIFAIAAGLMASATAAQAGPLLPKLQAGVAQLGGAATAGVGSAIALPTAVLTGNGAPVGAGSTKVLPELSVAALPGLETVSPEAEGDWLDYNLNHWPTELTTWASMQATYAEYGAGLVVDRAAQGPVADPSCEICTPQSPYADYARDLLGLGNGTLGLVVGPLPPLPKRPTGMIWWVDWNLDYYPADLMSWASYRRNDAALRVDDIAREASVSGGNPLAALADGALGLVVGPLPPLPYLPTEY